MTLLLCVSALLTLVLAGVIGIWLALWLLMGYLSVWVGARAANAS